MKIIENLGINDYLSLIGIILTAYVTQFYYKYFTRINPLPGPLPFPLVGNLPQFFWYGGNIKTFLEHCKKEYGDVYEVCLKERNIVLNRVEHIEKFLTPSTKSSYISRAPLSNELEELGVKGTGITFNDDLKSWRHNRQFFMQAISAPKFTQEAIDCTNKFFNEMGDYWNKLYLQKGVKENKNKLDFSKWLNNFTNDVIISLLTGERSYTMAGYFNILSGEKVNHSQAIIENSVKLVGAFRKNIMGISHFININPFLRHYVPYFKNKSNDYVQNIRFIRQEIGLTIKKRRQDIENIPLNEPLPRDMLTLLITANTARDVNYTETDDNETMEPMNDTEICSILIDGFGGGTDTTANLIAFIVYYVVRNPDAKRKMLEEIERVFEGDKTRPITEGDYQKLKYCEAVVKEVSRVFPVAHSLAKYNEEPDEIAGYEWPASTWFLTSVSAIHKSEDYWEDPEKFNPDRWLTEKPKKNSFIMFGGGLRICPGRKLAMIELVCLTALLFRKYDIDLVEAEAPLKTINSVLTFCSELLINIKLRN